MLYVPDPYVGLCTLITGYRLAYVQLNLGLYHFTIRCLKNRHNTALLGLSSG